MSDSSQPQQQPQQQPEISIGSIVEAASGQQQNAQQVRAQAINTLIAAARKGQQAGAYSLQEAGQIFNAIQALVGGQQQQ